jgi:hypothetical protein
MSDIPLRIDVPGANTVVARFDELPQDIERRLAGPIAELTHRMLGRAQAEEPDRTGQLRADTRAFVDRRHGFIRGRVRVVLDEGGSKTRRGSVAAGKAAALEYGAHGVAKVRAHEMMLGHLFGRAIEPKSVLVEAYTRHVAIAAVHFLSDAFDGVPAAFREAVEKAVAAATKSF